jgi:hypothetical protein
MLGHPFPEISPHMGLQRARIFQAEDTSITRGIALKLERMIPACGIIVKHKFPYACLFRNFERGRIGKL